MLKNSFINQITHLQKQGIILHADVKAKTIRIKINPIGEV
jgi:hypothetical protein